MFETINTPGAPFFRAPSVGLTLLTSAAAPARVSETLKPELIKLMVAGSPKEADKLVRGRTVARKRDGTGKVEINGRAPVMASGVGALKIIVGIKVELVTAT